MFDIQNMMSLQKPPATPHEQENAARQVAGEFLKMVLGPMLTHHGDSFGGDSWMGNGATSDSIIQPMMVQQITSALAQNGDALGLYPIFLKAIQRIEEQKQGVSA